MNIVYINQIPYVTDKETFPTKPDFYPCDSWKQTDCPIRKSGFVYCECKNYESDVADFIRDHCSPIVEEDQENILWSLFRLGVIKVGSFSSNPAVIISEAKKVVVDHTIYKVEGLELEEIEQRRSILNMTWMENKFPKDTFLFEYRRAFRVVETKEI